MTTTLPYTIRAAVAGKMKVVTATIPNASLDDVQTLADITAHILTELGKWVDDSRVAWETVLYPPLGLQTRPTLTIIARYRYLP